MISQAAIPARRTLLGLSLVTLLAGASLPAAPPAAQATDPDFAARVAEWTTSPEFLSPLVDHLPLADGVPTPKDVLGYHVGTPQKLTYTAEALGYYRALAAASPRVRVTTIGVTDEGREITVVFVGSEETLRDLDGHRADLARLADPRGLDEEEARAIIARAKPIYFFSAGLHSGETGPPEMLLEMAYRLAVSESPLIRRIRDEVIVALLPAADPDGRDRYVDWYYRHLVDITDERDRLPGPPYWGRYVFHDNNRDINYSQTSMRALIDWYLQWHPPIMHDLHESVPFLYTFSGQAPQNPALDPILYAEMPWFANFEMTQLTKYGMPGVWTHAFVDMWSPGYLAFMSSNHNGLVRMYETYGNGGATTMKRRVAPAQGGAGQTSREWYRPNPPYREVVWSMRNNTNYMQTAALTALELTSMFPKVVLENFYVKSRNAVRDGRATTPHGFVVPAGQRDPTRVARLVELLRVQGIEIGRASKEFSAGGTTYPPGSLIVKRDQPYGRLARILLERQQFPDPSLRTYDDTGWTMGLMLGVDVRPIDDVSVLEVPVTPMVREAVVGRVAGPPRPAGYVVPHRGANAMITLRHRLASFDVETIDAASTIEGLDVPAGSFVVPTGGRAEVHTAVREAVVALGLEAHGVARLPDGPRHRIDLPRLAVYSTWGNTQDVGWVRHALDRFEVRFDLIYKERVRQGALRRDYDVILVPSQGRTAKGLVYDIESKGVPLAYRKTDRFRFLGEYGESDDITGGMGLEGALELKRFVDEGGVLVTLGVASFFPPEFGLTRSVNAARPSPQFYAPGPIVEAEILAPGHPIFHGYDAATLPVRYGNGPLLQVPEVDVAAQVLMRYRGGNAGVLSGLMRGADEISNRPAIVDVPVGAGRVVLFAGNPCYRWQNHGEFGLLFNTILHWNRLGTAAPAAGRTTAELASR